MSNKSFIEQEIKGFDNWERDILLEYQADMEIFLINFIRETDKNDFLHNIADVLFRCKFNNIKKAKEELREKRFCLKSSGHKNKHKITPDCKIVVKWENIEKVLGKCHKQ